MSRSSKADEYIKSQRAKPTPRIEKRWKLDLLIEKDVYPTGELAARLIQHLEDQHVIRNTTVVLDYGSGTGFYAIAAAQLGAAHVVAVDINEAAIECARKNIEKYQQQDRVELRHGNAFDLIKPEEKFDIIFAGMPWEDGEANDVYERSFYDPGFHMRRELFAHAYQNLAPGGYILTTYAERVQAQTPFETTFCEPYKLHCEVILTAMIREPHFVYNITTIGEIATDGDL